MFTTWEPFNVVSLGFPWSEVPWIGLSLDSGLKVYFLSSFMICMKVAGKVLSFFHPPRYDRRPSSSSRRYSELLATGIVEEPTEEEWRKKNLSACILAADPECLPSRGKVILDK